MGSGGAKGDIQADLNTNITNRIESNSSASAFTNCNVDYSFTVTRSDGCYIGTVETKCTASADAMVQAQQEAMNEIASAMDASNSSGALGGNASTEMEMNVTTDIVNEIISGCQSDAVVNAEAKMDFVFEDVTCWRRTYENGLLVYEEPGPVLENVLLSADSQSQCLTEAALKAINSVTTDQTSVNESKGIVDSLGDAVAGTIGALGDAFAANNPLMAMASMLPVVIGIIVVIVLVVVMGPMLKPAPPPPPSRSGGGGMGGLGAMTSGG